MMKRTALCCMFLALATPALGADVPTPIATDSRIKTFVYSENDVFSLVTHYGYQSNIEFGLQEEIETISLGDRIGWQIVPAGRRLFIRAMAVNARTNMTVVTNKRAYQFDLSSVAGPVSPTEELVYVVRFFYPDDKKNGGGNNSGYPTSQLPMNAPLAQTAATTGYTAPTPVSSSPAAMPVTPAQSPGFNYSYTFTGSDAIAPLKLFDDGSSTYFKFRSMGNPPRISSVATTLQQTPLTVRRAGEYWAVDTVAPRFVVQQDSQTVNVYNEKLSQP